RAGGRGRRGGSAGPVVLRRPAGRLAQGALRVLQEGRDAGRGRAAPREAEAAMSALLAAPLVLLAATGPVAEAEKLAAAAVQQAGAKPVEALALARRALDL